MAVQTPVKPDILRHLLRDHPNQHFVKRLIDNLTDGADIGFVGSRHSRYTANSATARTHRDILSNSINKEVSLSHAVGPFELPPFSDFIVSSLGVREKKSGGHRVILDLSRPAGDSVNDHIDPEAFSVGYCSIDDAIRSIMTAGRGCFLAKLDIQHAFRLIPVKPSDWPLLGYQVNGQFYFDIVLPFGLRSSPYLFCMLSDAFQWIFQNVSKQSLSRHYVDDYLLVALTRLLCSAQISLFLKLAKLCGIPILQNFLLSCAIGPATLIWSTF